MALTREQIRNRIDALECLDSVQEAIGYVDVEWGPGETRAFDLSACTTDTKLDVLSVFRVPPSVLLVGLHAMERELAAMADVREVA